jgi:hypothetical protein
LLPWRFVRNLDEVAMQGTRRMPMCSRAALLSAGLLVFLVLPPAAASETVTIGQTGTSPGGGCSMCNVFQTASDPLSPSYTVPSGSWSIASWSAAGGTMFDGDLRLRVWRPTGVAGHYRLFAESGEQTIVHGSTPSFTVNIPVQGGDLLGLRSASNAGGPGNVPIAVTSANSGDEITSVVGGDPTVGDEVPGGSFTTPVTPARMTNVAATLQRPDPVPSPAAAPPDTLSPQTRIDKGPTMQSTKATVKFKFGSDEAGASFECKLDRKPFKPCRSPRTYKHLVTGKHTFKVRATDTAGNTDPTPAKRNFVTEA